MNKNLIELVTELYAHSIMTLDDILYIAKNNSIKVKLSVDDKLTATANGEDISFDVTCDHGLIYIFDI